MSKNTGTSELINYFDLGVNGDVGIAGSLDINTIANATTDTDTFLVSDTGIIKYRTGAQLLSDIGAAPAVAGGYVPYTGATTNVDLGVYNLTASAIIANGSGSNSGIVHLESNAIHSLVNGYGSIASGTTNQFNLYQTTGAGVFRGAILSLNSITEFATRTFTLPNTDGTIALTSQIPANAVGGTGTTNTLSKFTASTTIGNSSITDDGTIVSILNSSFTDVLRVGSTTRFLYFYPDSGSVNIMTGAGFTGSGITFAGASNYLDFNTNSLTRMRLSNAGNLLVGTTTDNGARLQVSGTATISSSVTAVNAILSGTGSTFADGLRINRTTSNSTQYTVINHVGGATNIVSVDQSGNNIAEIYFGRSINGSTISTSMVINGSGNVGIGTINPSYKLDILGTSGNVTTDTSNGTLVNIDGGSITSTNFGVGLGFVRTGSQMAYIKAARENASDEAGYLIFATQTAAGSHPERMRITSGGNTVLGGNAGSGWSTAGGRTTLEIYGSIYPTALHNSSSVGNSLSYNTYWDGANWRFVQGGTSVIYIQDSEGHKFLHNSSGTAGASFTPTERMRITSGGNVLIGTTTDNGAKLQVNGNVFINGFTSNSLTNHGERFIPLGGPNSSFSFNVATQFPSLAISGNVLGVRMFLTIFGSGGSVYSAIATIARNSGGTWSSYGLTSITSTASLLQSITGSGTTITINTVSGSYVGLSATAIIQ